MRDFRDKMSIRKWKEEIDKELFEIIRETPLLPSDKNI